MHVVMAGVPDKKLSEVIMKSQKDIISVIVPVYNVEDYLETCLDSLVSQTYKNLEIILVDDGSIDQSGAICDSYANKYHQIHVIHQANQGVSAARNAGLRYSHGNYIGFVDPDDFLDSNMYEFLLKNMKEYRCQIATCGVQNIDYFTREVMMATPQIDDVVLNKENFLKRLLNGKDMTTSVWNKLFDRDLIQNIYFDESMKIGEDFDWLFRIVTLKDDFKIIHSSELLYSWVRRSVSAIQGQKFNFDMEKSIELTYEIKNYVTSNFPDISSYAIKCCLFATLSGYEKCDDINMKKKLEKNIKLLEKDFMKSKDIPREEKIKFVLKFKYRNLYQFLKNMKHSRREIPKTKLYDVMKILCVILVVLGHITRMYTDSSVFPMVNSSHILNLLTKVIYTFQMPCFMLISGCIFGYCIEKGKYQDYFQFVWNKFKRLILPYLGIGLLVLAPTMVCLHITNLSYLRYCIDGILLMIDCRHLWYLPVLFIIFCSTIFLKRCYLTKWGFLFLILNFVLIYCSPVVPSILQCQNLLYYQFYFYLGFVLNQVVDKLIQFSNRHLVILLILSFIFLLTKAAAPEGIIFDVIYACIGIYLVFILSIFMYQKIRLDKTRVYRCLIKNSFGIYLFHPIIIYVIFYFVKDVYYNPYLLTIMSFFLTICISNLFTELVRRTPFRIFIGEKL